MQNNVPRKKLYFTEKQFMKNQGLPLCVNCLHFIENKTNYPYVPLPNDSMNGKCKKFGVINIITGEIDYDFAKYCRKDENKCGKMGTEYSEKTM